MSENIKNGKLDVMGVNINIAEVLGEKIIDQYMGQLTDEDMKTIMDFISQDFLIKKEQQIWNYDEQKYNTKMVTSIKRREKNSWGSYSGDLTIGELIQSKFNQRIKDELVKKVEEIIASADYQEKIEEIANDLVDYSVEGYKQDMKERMRERLVGNVIDSQPYYGGYSIRDIVNRIVDERMNY